MGSCDTDNKKIVINPDIVKYDREIIEYIVLHEFAHLKYKIHAKGFTKIMNLYSITLKKYQSLLKNIAF